MNAANAIVVVFGVVATAVTVAWMLLNRRHPERASSRRRRESGR